MKFLIVDEPHKHHPGPALLLAGPGSGKTHSIGLRIKWLVEAQNVSPKAITVITFTTEAARNLRLRLNDVGKADVYMPKEQQPDLICTMHSLGHHILRRSLGYLRLNDDFRILSSDELRTAIFGDAAQLLGYARGIGNDAKAAKMKAENMPSGSQYAEICKTYSSILRACNALDHDDQILLACQILREDPVLLAGYQGKARHLLVDEYQDINLDQFELIRLISAESRNGLYVVGDDDQSIYGFRGGSPEFIKHFDEHFGEAASILTLPYCRRCPPKVLNGALEVVKEFNTNRLEKPDPKAISHEETSIIIYDIPSDIREAELIAQICAEVLPARDVLILVPTIRFAEPITGTLKKRRIQYECRPSIEDDGLSQISRVFEFLTDPRNSLALRHFIYILCENGALGIPGKRAKKKENIDKREESLRVLSALWKHVLDNSQTLLESLEESSQEHGLLGTLRNHITNVMDAYTSDLDVFLQAVGKTLKPWKQPDDLAREIKSWMGEITGRGGGHEGIVRILTMRMAKGLEADHVFIVGLEEGVFPSHKWSGDEILEASRLFYVSMTRAKTRLHISHVRKREASVTFLPDSYKLKPSRFLQAIPKETAKVVYIRSDAQRKVRHL